MLHSFHPPKTTVFCWLDENNLIMLLFFHKTVVALCHSSFTYCSYILFNGVAMRYFKRITKNVLNDLILKDCGFRLTV